MIHQRAHRVFRQLFHIAQIGVKRARCGVVQRCGLVVRTRRALLGEFGHSLDYDLRFRLRFEVRIEPRAHFVDDRLIVLEQLRATGVVVSVELFRRGVEFGDFFRTRAARETRAEEDRVHRGTYARDLVESQLVNLRGRHRGRGVRFNLILVVGIAIGQRPCAVVRRGLTEQRFKLASERSVRWQHAVLDGRFNTRGERGAGRSIHFFRRNFYEFFFEGNGQFVAR